MRLTNVFGPRQRLRDDLQGFLPIFVRRALADEAITVFGDGRSSATACTSTTSSSACCSRRPRPRRPGEIFNVGNDEHLSLREIADAVVAGAGLGPGRARAVAARSRRDRHRLVLRRLVEGEADARLAAATSFADGIARTLAFYRAPRVQWYLMTRRRLTPRFPFVDLARRAAALEPELSEAVDRVVRSGAYLLGPELARVRAEFAAFAGRRHAIGVASGTEALRLVAGRARRRCRATR